MNNKIQDNKMQNNKILVIDDDPKMLNSYMMVLQPAENPEAALEAAFDVPDEGGGAADFTVVTAPQGKRGYELAKEAFEEGEPFAVTFLDMRMPPGWDGLATAKALREIDDRIYVVIVTAFADKSVDELQDAMKHDVLLLRKPFVSEEIYQLARSLCISWNRDIELAEYREQLEHKVAQRTEETVLSYEKLTEAVEAKHQFFAGMNHDIRTPMNCILGLAEQLLDTHIDDEQRKSLGLIRDAGSELLVIIEKVMAMSGIKSDNVQVKGELFSPAQVVGKIKGLIEPTIKKKGLELRWLISNSVPEQVEGDGGMFWQVASNLLFNAVKFTDKGTISLNMTVKDKSRTDVELLVSIRDTGIGIPLNMQKKIFEPCEQVVGRDKSMKGSAGLGLAIATKLTKLMHGTISLASGVGTGSLFSFNARFGLPPELKDEEQDKRPAASADAEDMGGALIPCRALVVDDEPVNLKVICSILAKWDFEVITAENGKAAMEMIDGGGIDVVLTDINMPIMDGYELTTAIRKKEADTDSDRLPVIMVTGVAGTDSRMRCKDIGADEFIEKPISKKKLFKAMKPHVGLA